MEKGIGANIAALLLDIRVRDERDTQRSASATATGAWCKSAGHHGSEHRAGGTGNIDTLPGRSSSENQAPSDSPSDGNFN